MFMDFPMIPMGLRPGNFPFFTTPLTNWNGLNDWNAVCPISTEPIFIHFSIPTAVQAAYGAFSASGDMNRWILLVIGLRTNATNWFPCQSPQKIQTYYVFSFYIGKLVYQAKLGMVCFGFQLLKFLAEVALYRHVNVSRSDIPEKDIVVPYDAIRLWLWQSQNICSIGRS